MKNQIPERQDYTGVFTILFFMSFFFDLLVPVFDIFSFVSFGLVGAGAVISAAINAIPVLGQVLSAILSITVVAAGFAGWFLFFTLGLILNIAAVPSFLYAFITSEIPHLSRIKIRLVVWALVGEVGTLGMFPGWSCMTLYSLYSVKKEEREAEALYNKKYERRPQRGVREDDLMPEGEYSYEA